MRQTGTLEQADCEQRRLIVRRVLFATFTAILLAAIPGFVSANEDPAARAFAFERASTYRLVAHLDPESPTFGAVDVEGLPPSLLEEVSGYPPAGPTWRKTLAIRTVAAERDDGPALLGTWQVEGPVLRFSPLFLPEAGVDLTARFDAAALVAWIAEVWADAAEDANKDLEEGAVAVVAPEVPWQFEESDGLELVFALPVPPPREDTRVVGLLPRVEEVPENLLRLYVSFSASMTAGDDIDEHVSLIDGDGAVIPDAFVAIPEGLWDQSRKRLTLVVHPGRIKQGVGPHEAMGSVLTEGETVRLRIDRNLRDAFGRPLAEDFVADLQVGPADRTPPDPEAWTIEPPSGGASPLTVEVPEPLDPRILRRALQILDANGEAVPGEVRVSPEGRRWELHPSASWRSGEFRLRVEPFLEDLAGNRIGVAFDRPTPNSEDGDEAGPVTIQESPAVERVFWIGSSR